MDYISCKAGNRYRIISDRPNDWGDKYPDKPFPAKGLVGICKFTNSVSGACLNIGGIEYIIPYDLIEETKDEGIEDAILVTIMLDNPEGVLKLLRGLWRMTKHITIRDFMERSILPPDPESNIPLKPREECNENWNEWEEYCRETGMMVSGC